MRLVNFLFKQGGFFFTVFTGRHTGILFKQIAEIMPVTVADLGADLRGAQLCGLQKFFCLGDPEICQIFCKGDAHFLRKNSGKTAV